MQGLRENHIEINKQNQNYISRWESLFTKKIKKRLGWELLLHSRENWKLLAEHKTSPRHLHDIKYVFCNIILSLQDTRMTDTTALIPPLKCKSLSSHLDYFEFFVFCTFFAVYSAINWGCFYLTGEGEGVRRPIALTLSNPNRFPTGHKYRTLTSTNYIQVPFQKRQKSDKIHQGGGWEKAPFSLSQFFPKGEEMN